MKLRLRDDTLRLRLTQGEVATLADRGRLEAHTRLAGASLVYALESSDEADAPEARLALASHRAELVVRLPKEQIEEWARGDEVGIYGEQEIPPHEARLQIAVEKDFRCLTPRNEDEDPADAFPHPEEGSEVC